MFRHTCMKKVPRTLLKDPQVNYPLVIKHGSGKSAIVRMGHGFQQAMFEFPPESTPFSRQQPLGESKKKSPKNRRSRDQPARLKTIPDWSASDRGVFICIYMDHL